MLTEYEIIDATIRFLRSESERRDAIYAYCPLAGKECNGYMHCMFDKPMSSPCLLYRDTYKKIADWVEEARKKEGLK